MPSFSYKGADFHFPNRFSAGHLPLPGESSAINRYITGTLKLEIASGRIKTRAEAFAFIMSDACLAPRAPTNNQSETPGIDLLEGL